MAGNTKPHYQKEKDIVKQQKKELYIFAQLNFIKYDGF